MAKKAKAAPKVAPKSAKATKAGKAKAIKATKTVTKAKSGKPLSPDALAEDAALKELFLEHRRKITGIEAKLAAVQALVDDAYADAKADKLPKKLFKIAIDLTGSEKKEQKVIEEVRTRIWVSDALGHPLGQMDLFADVFTKPAAANPRAEGAEASRTDQQAKPPYAAGTIAHNEWLEGYHEDQRRLMGGFKPTVVGGTKAKKEPAPSLDDDDFDTSDESKGADPARALPH